MITWPSLFVTRRDGPSPKPAHVNLRVNLAAQGSIYLESFYFLMYGAILPVAVNSIILASPNHPRFLVHQGNLIASLLYWPVVKNGPCHQRTQTC